MDRLRFSDLSIDGSTSAPVDDFEDGLRRLADDAGYEGKILYNNDGQSTC